MEVDTSMPYVITNILAVGIAITAMLWPTVARLLLGIMFVGAFVVNVFTAITNPSSYLAFGELTDSLFYRSIILGPFSKHILMYVSAIAVCQLLIGVFICYKGFWIKLAMAGAIAFLLAISPLGEGSAFPAPLIMALAVLILLYKRISFNVFERVSRSKAMH